jgi:hypothetical protein
MRLFISREIVAAGLCNWWGSMPCDLFSNPILTEKTPVQLGCNAFGNAFGLKGVPSQKAPEI